jgi:glycosyltransferase involved in cell wall biosynthesis
MKVLFTFGGMPHYLNALLLKIQQNEGIEICVVIPDAKGKSIGKGVKLSEEIPGFKVIKLPEYNTFLKKPFFKDFLEVIKSEKPDIIVVGWPYIVPLSLKFRLLSYIKRKHIGLIFREIPFNVAPYNKAFSFFREHPLLDEDLNNNAPKGLRFFFWALSLKYLLKWYYSVIDASLAYAVTAYEIQESYGLKEEQIFVSCNSPDTEVLFNERDKILAENSELNYSPFRLIHIGRLVKWKRVDLLIEACHKLFEEFPEIELLIIGTGPEEESLKNQVIKLGMSGYVNFAGSIYKEDLSRHIMSSGIYVLAGMGGLSINEAMAFGKPVVCSVCDGTEKTLVREGFNGLYFENGNVESLAEKIKYLFDNQHLIPLMGKNSEDIIRNEVNLSTVSKEFMRCFEYVYNKKNK